MEPSDPHPYQAPNNSAEIAGKQRTRRKRPNVFDWIFAIVLGVIAFAIAVPTTCYGGIFVGSIVGKIFSPQSFLGPWVATIGILAAIIFLLGSPLLAAILYIRAVKKSQVKRAEIKD